MSDDKKKEELQQALWLRQSEELDKQRLQEMQEAGRYTLEGAATMLEQHAGEIASEMLDMLMQSRTAKALTVHAPGRNAPYQSDTPRVFYEEAYWDDLNFWLVANTKRITWRFPAPTQSGIPADAPAGEDNHAVAGVSIAHKSGDKWTDDELQALLQASESGLTQDALAKQYGYKRQRISALLKRAREQFNSKSGSTDLAKKPFATLVSFDRNK